MSFALFSAETSWLRATGCRRIVYARSHSSRMRKSCEVDHRLGLAVLFAGFFVTLGFALNVDREPRLRGGVNMNDVVCSPSCSIYSESTIHTSVALLSLLGCYGKRVGCRI
ncbi:unnamed protein product [Symbiodinium natans]|uniref:Uncharacterized protein n=1 Tax=Symbiodinium natans TaxID=878477 RepID=A0A812PRY3_9DINO|nr:unnamed protein product [Symbiodinium natans]